MKFEILSAHEETSPKHVDDDDKIMNERNLIANRLERLNIIVDDATSICPKHRSSFGIVWFQSKQCYHPDYDPKRPAHSTDCRPASLDVSSRIQDFPIGGCLCTVHRKNQQKIDRHCPSMDDITIGTQSSNFIVDDTRTHVNQILEQANISPINSQSRKTLKEQPASGIRRLLSKFRRTVDTLREPV
ncbi:unnamed protein product [Didymodactylos carnosus]|uniref:Uncharacterized protein n=1 Tax=Didymodactylos carnosus TaxID=1234261 RepID=A0A8S2DQZ8_9BILA|nr:unnamed protein product [Didymodactylos carnosus]CAF3777107.1 unnamed protein product [Didymodactylos carnosus]